MSGNFWQKLKKRNKTISSAGLGRPILALAPLAGFTDSAFRQICRQCGADVVYSEMASSAALFYNQLPQVGKRNKKNTTLELLKFNSKQEKYYVVQLFGSNPEHFAVAARIVTNKIKPDGIDLNFGCPVPKIIKQGAGAGLMKDLKNSRAVIKAVLANTDLPVSIKIRTKSGTVGALEFLDNINDLPVAAVMIHGRSLTQGFSGEADWSLIKAARRHFSGIILANGGINSLVAARQALKISGADGLGLARGVLGRPWLFKEIKNNVEINKKPIAVFKIALKHAELVEELKGNIGIVELRKHLVWYTLGLPKAAHLRAQLVKSNKLEDIQKILFPIKD